MIQRNDYMGFFIRSMEEKDISDVQKVARTSWNATYDGIIPPSIQKQFLKTAYSKEAMKRRLIHSFLFVAISGKKLIGFANFSPVNEDGVTELGAIYLHPEYQRKGIGTALLEYGITHLSGVKDVLIHVEKNNQIGLNFYQGKGFEELKEFEESLYGHVVKTIQMNLKVIDKHK